MSVCVCACVEGVKEGIERKKVSTGSRGRWSEKVSAEVNGNGPLGKHNSNML